jgi:hypothetical protein
MHRMAKHGSPVARVRRAGVLLLLLALMAGLAAPAVASHTAEVIVLPGASSAEGIAAGRGATFYAGDLFRGDIFRGNVRRGTAELFIDAPEGRMATGMKVDVAHHLLFVAGGFTGQAYVYDTRTGATVATYQFAAPGPATAPPTTVINDVAITPPRRLVHRFCAGQALLRAAQPLRGTRAVQDPCPQRPGRRHQRRLQPQRHRGHGQRQDPDRGPFHQGSAVHGRPEDRGQRDHCPGLACQLSTASCWRAGGCGRCRTATR